MVLTKNMMYYEARAAFGFAALLPLLALPLFALIGSLVWAGREFVPQSLEILRVFELVLPLTAGLSAGHLMSVEREEGFDEIWRTYPEHSWELALRRALGVSGLALMSAGLSLLFFRITNGIYLVSDVLLPVLPPALFLMSLAMLVNNVAGNYWIAAGAVVAYWAMEFQTGGQYTGVFYLFQASMPAPDVDYTLNRWLLLGLALALQATNVGFSAWRRRGSIGG